MLTEAPERTVQSSGIGETHTSVIHATPEMFEILSNQLYTDKPAAVVRELLCNAIDAHLEADTDAPIEVHLPTLLEPHFEIRDYGIGIDPADVPDRMMSFGGGDKGSKADLIGAFGLGMKSPWSLTDQFTIETRWYGRRVLFSAYIQPDGRPGCAQLTEAETDESNGVTVYVPLDQATARDPSFANMLGHIYRRSPVPIHVTPGEHWTAPEERRPTYVIDSVNEHCARLEVTRNAQAGQTGLIVTMGPVPYTLSTPRLRELVRERVGEDHRAFQLFNKLWPMARYELHMHLGSVQVTASREQISEDDQTRGRILQALVDGLDQLYARLEAQLNEAETLREWLNAQDLIAFGQGLMPPNSEWLAYLNGQAKTLRLDQIFGPNARFRTLAEHAPVYKKRYRSANDRRFIGPQDLDTAAVLVTPKMNGFSQYLREQHDWHQHQMALVVKGNADEIRAHLRSLGFQTPVREIPANQRRSSGNRQRASLGAAQYTVQLLVNDGRGFRRLKQTADDIRDDYANDTVLLTSEPFQIPGLYDRLCREGLMYPANNRRIAIVHVPKHHNRVRRTLLDELGAIDSRSVDQELIKRLAYDDLQVVRKAGRLIARRRIREALEKREVRPGSNDQLIEGLLTSLARVSGNAIVLNHDWQAAIGLYRQVREEPAKEKLCADLINDLPHGDQLHEEAADHARRLLRRMWPRIAERTWRIRHINRFIPGIRHLFDNRWLSHEIDAIARMIAEMKEK